MNRLTNLQKKKERKTRTENQAIVRFSLSLMETSGLGWVGHGMGSIAHAYTTVGFPSAPHVHVVRLWEENGAPGERSAEGWPLDTCVQMNSVSVQETTHVLDCTCQSRSQALTSGLATVSPARVKMIETAALFNPEVQKFMLEISSKQPAVCSSNWILALWDLLLHAESTFLRHLEEKTGHIPET